MAKAPKVTEDTAAPEVTPEVTEEEAPLSASTLAEIEAGKAALAKFAKFVESSSAE